jgi:FSR family fosmidomycin resistance protein-like MFS transporter
MSERMNGGGGSFQTSRLLTIAGGHAAHDTFTAFLPPLLPFFAARLFLSNTEAGLLAVILQLPWVLQPLIGHYADRNGAALVVILAPAASALAMSLLGIAPGYIFLVLLLLLSGIASAGFHAVAPAMISALSGRSIGRGMGIWMVGGELGRTLGPLLAVTALRFLGPEGLPWLALGGIAASLLLALQLRRPEEATPTIAGGPEWRSLLRGLIPLLLPIGGVMLLRSFLVTALNLYLPLFLTEEGANLWLAGVSLTILEAAGVAGALAGGSISDRIGRRLTLAVSLRATPVLLLLFLFASGWVQLLLLIFLGLTGLSVTPVIMAIIQESFPGNRAFANGTYMLMSFGIRTAAIVSLGVIGDLSSLRFAYTVSAVAALAGVPLLFFLPGRRPGTE